MLPANFQRVRGFDAEWKLLRRPSKHRLPNLAPLNSGLRKVFADHSPRLATSAGSLDCLAYQLTYSHSSNALFTSVSQGFHALLSAHQTSLTVGATRLLTFQRNHRHEIT